MKIIEVEEKLQKKRKMRLLKSNLSKLVFLIDEDRNNSLIEVERFPIVWTDPYPSFLEVDDSLSKTTLWLLLWLKLQTMQKDFYWTWKVLGWRSNRSWIAELFSYLLNRIRETDTCSAIILKTREDSYFSAWVTHFWWLLQAAATGVVYRIEEKRDSLRVCSHRCYKDINFEIHSSY